MTSKVFLEWFQKFVLSVTQRPLLLLLDGHVSHISMEVISAAVEENIIIVKLPPHATNVLQPLDVTCFGLLKQKWSKLLAACSNISGSRSSLTKSSFVDELAHTWNACLSESNVKSGFSSTGIFPVDRSKYPTKRFNPRLLRRSQRWEGKVENMEFVATSAVTLSKNKPAQKETHEKLQCFGYCAQLGPEPSEPAGEEMVWIPAWISVPAATAVVAASTAGSSTQHLASSTPNTSFEELLLEKIKPASHQAPPKRRRINMKGVIITDKAFAKKIENVKK